MADDTPRCTRCTRPISAPLSLILGLGSACRRHADPTETAAIIARAIAAVRQDTTEPYRAAA